MEYYVYVWRDSANVPFYVGKGKGRRAQNTTMRSVEFKEIYAQGGCTVEIVDWFIHEAQAHAYEIELIGRYGRREHGGVLVNKTDGGEGAGGWVPSAAMRAKLSALYRGKAPSAEALAKSRAACTGKPLSEDHRLKIGASQRGKSVSNETRAKISAALRGRTFDAEWRAKIGAASRGRTPSDETRAKLSLAGQGRILTKEDRSKVSYAARMRPPRSGFKGVTAHGDKWRARIKVDGKLHLLGSFSEPEEAARAYDDALVHFFGPGPWYRNFRSDHHDLNHSDGQRSRSVP